MLKQLINDDWYQLLKPEFEKEYFLKLETYLEEAYKNNTIYPGINYHILI